MRPISTLCYPKSSKSPPNPSHLPQTILVGWYPFLVLVVLVHLVPVPFLVLVLVVCVRVIGVGVWVVVWFLPLQEMEVVALQVLVEVVVLQVLVPPLYTTHLSRVSPSGSSGLVRESDPS